MSQITLQRDEEQRADSADVDKKIEAFDRQIAARIWFLNLLDRLEHSNAEDL